MRLPRVHRCSTVGAAVRGLLSVVWLALALMISGGASSATLAGAEGCAPETEQVRNREPYAARLPDCRAYEQVSPVDKNQVDAQGLPQRVQASSPGGGVTFFSETPFPIVKGSRLGLPRYVSLRVSDGSGWSTAALMPESEPNNGVADQVHGWSGDLADTILTTGEPAPCVCGASGFSNAYVRNNLTGAYEPLAGGIQRVYFADATPGGSHVLFETEQTILGNIASGPAPASGVNNVYEWSRDAAPGAQTNLVGILPNGTVPGKGSVAGPGGPLINNNNVGGAIEYYYTQGTLSNDGSRAFFTDSETGIVYMRELVAGRTVRVSAGQALWRAGTPGGSFVFYTEGLELYRFNVARFEKSEKPEEEALAEAREQITDGAEGVLGMFGVSDDGSYAYFVAPGVLAGNENGGNEKAQPGAGNLYEWHAGDEPATIFIASAGDTANWTGRFNEQEGGPGQGGKTSRVTPDGRAVLFASNTPPAQINGAVYNNNGQVELYLYAADRPLSLSNPTCVSCNPSGVPAIRGAVLTVYPTTVARPSPVSAFLTHNLSNGGERVFFESEEALLPGLIAGGVYEWEREGVGGCVVGGGDGSDGCLFLISTSTDVPTHVGVPTQYFGDASADGRDVFFFTRQPLVGQDRDDNVDVYDARENGGILAQNPLPVSPSCVSVDACRGVSPSVPVLGGFASGLLSGSGNVVPTMTGSPEGTGGKVVRCSRGKKRVRGRCVRSGKRRARGKRAGNHGRRGKGGR